MKSVHVVPIKTYAAVFIGLVVLTLTTAGAAFIDLGGGLNAVVALAIAIGKTLLVTLYFMHLRYSRPLTWVFAGAGIFWLMILLTLTLSDVVTRDWLAAITR
jgi:cytochrome c oxidase subunit IV